MLFRFIDRKSIAIPPKFFPKPLKDSPQLDFSSEITLENKRKNEEKIEKKRGFIENSAIKSHLKLLRFNTSRLILKNV